MDAPFLKLRVFVSSPGDVGSERAVAVSVVERLQLEFRGQIQVEAYLWERTILRATETFQSQIVDIQEVDLAIFVLWSRIGTPLPVAQFSRPDGSQYLSGTEYEFERAREAFEAKGSPEILCYLKTAEIRFSLKDRDERARRNHELDGVGTFVDKWFRNPDGTFRSAFYSFEKTAQFEEQVEIHLRDWIRDRLRDAQGGSPERSVWQGSPFRGLEVFDYEHALIYCGRTQMIAEALDTLRRRAQEGHPFLMVTGMSGVGKSSLVRAGIVPLLSRPSVIEGVIGWRRASFKPNVSHSGLVASFAAALVAPDALPGLTQFAGGRSVEGLLADPAALTNAVIQALEVETKRAREARPDPDTDGVVRLILVVDQFEEIFDETISAVDRDAFSEALRTLLLTGRVWIIATLRADFFSRTANLPERFRDVFIEGGGLFTVGGPRSADIAQMIRRPATMAGLAFERRGDPEEGLDDVLRDAAVGNSTVLPLLEFTLDELWRRSQGSGVLTFADYEQIGGLHGALRLRADEEFARLPPAVQASLPVVLGAIVHTDPTNDRMILQNRVSASQFDERPDARRLVEAFVAARLLVADKAPDGTPVIALAHEALLREWPPAVQWIETNRELLRTRASISAAAALWRNSDRRDSRLLTGELLSDGQRLLKTGGVFLAPDERGFIELSAASDRRGRMTRIRRGALALVAVTLAILMPVVGMARLSQVVAIARTLPRVWGEQTTVPLSEGALANLRSSIEALTLALEQDLPRDPRRGAWSMAQVRAALHEVGSSDPEGGRILRRHVDLTRDPRCSCWRETSLKPQNEMATAWVLLSLAVNGAPATVEEITSLLARQNASGWWSIYPALPEPRNASTTITALVMKALQAQLDGQLVSPDLRVRVEEALARGVAWLGGLAPPGEARWPPYPPPPIGIWEQGDYPGASALVVHVLRRVTGLSDRDGGWIDQLSSVVPEVGRNEIAKANLIMGENESEIDDSRMYQYPWMLLSTVEAFRQGSWLQRARALVWIEKALRKPVQVSDFRTEFWVIGEVGYVLRQVDAAIRVPAAGLGGAAGANRSDRFRAMPTQ